MKIKALLILLIFMILLNGCTTLSIDYLVFELNPGIDTIEINDRHVDQGAKASYGFKTVDVIVISNNVDTTHIGEYEIIYQATYKELVQTLVRKVNVVDQTPPVLSLNPGIDTIHVGETWIDAGVQAYDNSLGETHIEIIGSVLNALGKYEIIYQATDLSGNVSRLTRVVYVIA